MFHKLIPCRYSHNCLVFVENHSPSDDNWPKIHSVHTHQKITWSTRSVLSVVVSNVTYTHGKPTIILLLYCISLFFFLDKNSLTLSTLSRLEAAAKLPEKRERLHSDRHRCRRLSARSLAHMHAFVHGSTSLVSQINELQLGVWN